MWVGSEQHLTKAPFTLKSHHRYDVLNIHLCRHLWVYLWSEPWLPLYHWTCASVEWMKPNSCLYNTLYFSHACIFILSSSDFMTEKVAKIHRDVHFWQCMFEENLSQTETRPPIFHCLLSLCCYVVYPAVLWCCKPPAWELKGCCLFRRQMMKWVWHWDMLYLSSFETVPSWPSHWLQLISSPCPAKSHQNHNW